MERVTIRNGLNLTCVILSSLQIVHSWIQFEFSNVLIVFKFIYSKLFNIIHLLFKSKSTLTGSYVCSLLSSNKVTCHLFHYQYRTNIYTILLAYFTTFYARLAMTGEGVDGVNSQAPVSQPDGTLSHTIFIDKMPKGLSQQSHWPYVIIRLSYAAVWCSELDNNVVGPTLK